MADHRVTLTTPWVDQWVPDFIGTLMFVRRADEVLLIHKKTGHGAGRINAPGGKLERGEGVVAGACRETLEEVGLTVTQARVAAELRFVELNGPQWLGFALLANHYAGEEVETREARPFWCPIAEIPYTAMWADDVLWLPALLRSTHTQPMVGNFLFDQGCLLEHRFDECESVWSQL